MFTGTGGGRADKSIYIVCPIECMTFDRYTGNSSGDEIPECSYIPLAFNVPDEGVRLGRILKDQRMAKVQNGNNNNNNNNSLYLSVDKPQPQQHRLARRPE